MTPTIMAETSTMIGQECDNRELLRNIGLPPACSIFALGIKNKQQPM